VFITFFQETWSESRLGEGVRAQPVEQHRLHDLADASSGHIRYQLSGNFYFSQDLFNFW